MIQCDLASGTCQIPGPAAPTAQRGSTNVALAVHYIGDPMCSWCWGISSPVHALAEYCESEGIPFVLTMGGLRAGGGDPWNDRFKDFLRNEWRHIGHATGQPFSFKLLDTPHFDYDTEPACRAIAAVQLLTTSEAFRGVRLLGFFSSMQQKFYVDGEDPKQPAFYDSICISHGINPEEFRKIFASAEAARAVQADFQTCRAWGVRSFPTLLIEREGALATLASGYVTAEHLIGRIQMAKAL
ncbi:TPA: hypothetical protein UL931_002029 [Stenotrophomonas maltophilia]|nr:hypothetical protein [Stenotrophomonas maltophilia]